MYNVNYVILKEKKSRKKKNNHKYINCKNLDLEFFCTQTSITVFINVHFVSY